MIYIYRHWHKYFSLLPLLEQDIVLHSFNGIARNLPKNGPMDKIPNSNHTIHLIILKKKDKSLHSENNHDL